MTLKRAYSVFTVKAVDEEQRIITGTATTPSTDSYGDIVEPEGAEYTLPLPLLWMHDTSQPVGNVLAAKVSPAGIEVKVKIEKITEPGKLKDRLDEAWQSVKAGLVRGFSIGFSALESARIKDTYSVHYLSWVWRELSLVVIPANTDCTIQTIKSIDLKQRAASGQTQREVVRLDSTFPGVTGNKPPKRKETQVKTIQEQIAAFESKRTASSERMSAIMQKAADEGRTLEDTETEEYDGLETEVASIDKHLVKLKVLEKANVARATAVTTQAGATIEGGSNARGGIVTVKSNLPKGTAFTRYVQALARSKGNVMQAAEMAKQWHDSTPEVEVVLKSAVAAGTTTDSDWAAPLVPYMQMTSEFIELLRPATIIGKLTGLRRVPFNIRIPRQTQGSTVGWVGETKPKPVSELKFDDITLRYTKVAGIVVISDELARLSTPAAEGIIRSDMIAQIAQFMDQRFIDPAYAAVANVSPASITNGVTPVVATGDNGAALRADIRTLFASFITANLSIADGVWITTPSLALAIGMIQNPLGQPEFPGITMNGGTLLGLPVIVSESVPTESNGALLVLVKQGDVLFADDGGVTIDVSREASLQMDSAPDDPVSASTVLVSLWQQNLVGIRAERWVNWSKRRSTAVAYIEGALYGQQGT